jgi:hypothetical protein
MESRILAELSKLRGTDHPANMLRILLLAPESNPDGITGPLVGCSHGEALARLHPMTVTTEVIDV